MSVLIYLLFIFLKEHFLINLSDNVRLLSGTLLILLPC